MSILNSSGQDPSEAGANELDPLARFRSWRGFLLVAIALNTLFVYGMFAGASDPSVKAWYKALTWLPFNLIASVLYFVFLVKLSKADEDCSKAAGGADKAGTNGALYVVLCVAMIAANWIAMFAA